VADIIVTSAGNRVYRVDAGTRVRTAYAIGPDDERWVFLDGRVFVVDVSTRAPGRRRKGTDEHGALAAPMPATVISIAAAPGQRVMKGDVLVVLEAMKMELPIKSPRDGTVKTIRCHPGELVQPGVPLLELE
jgi:biotin carboxyl carrier protein